MTMQVQLAEARQAYHKLMTGQTVVRIQRDGKTVEFKAADRAQLRSYITELESQIGASGRRRGPARLIG